MMSDVGGETRVSFSSQEMLQVWMQSASPLHEKKRHKILLRRDLYTRDEPGSLAFLAQQRGKTKASPSSSGRESGRKAVRASEADVRKGVGYRDVVSSLELWPGGEECARRSQLASCRTTQGARNVFDVEFQKSGLLFFCDPDVRMASGSRRTL